MIILGIHRRRALLTLKLSVCVPKFAHLRLMVGGSQQARTSQHRLSLRRHHAGGRLLLTGVRLMIQMVLVDIVVGQQVLCGAVPVLLENAICAY